MDGNSAQQVDGVPTMANRGRQRQRRYREFAMVSAMTSEVRDASKVDRQTDRQTPREYGYEAQRQS